MTDQVAAYNKLRGLLKRVKDGTVMVRAVEEEAPPFIEDHVSGVKMLKVTYVEVKR